MLRGMKPKQSQITFDMYMKIAPTTFVIPEDHLDDFCLVHRSLNGNS